jgi:hypothetical protein
VGTVVVLQGEWSGEGGREEELRRRPVMKPKGYVWSSDRRGRELWESGGLTGPEDSRLNG